MFAHCIGSRADKAQVRIHPMLHARKRPTLADPVLAILILAFPFLSFWVGPSPRSWPSPFFRGLAFPSSPFLAGNGLPHPLLLCRGLALFFPFGWAWPSPLQGGAWPSPSFPFASGLALPFPYERAWPPHCPSKARPGLPLLPYVSGPGLPTLTLTRGLETPIVPSFALGSGLVLLSFRAGPRLPLLPFWVGPGLPLSFEAWPSLPLLFWLGVASPILCFCVGAWPSSFLLAGPGLPPSKAGPGLPPLPLDGAAFLQLPFGWCCWFFFWGWSCLWRKRKKKKGKKKKRLQRGTSREGSKQLFI